MGKRCGGRGVGAGERLCGSRALRGAYQWEFLKYTGGGKDIPGWCTSGHSDVKELCIWTVGFFFLICNVKCEGLSGKRQDEKDRLDHKGPGVPCKGGAVIVWRKLLLLDP